MKIYDPKPLHLIRLTISKKDEETKYINFTGVSHVECIGKVTDIIDGLKLSAFHEGNSTRLDFRDCVGGKNGKSLSVSFKGLTPTETYNLLISKIEKNET